MGRAITPLLNWHRVNCEREVQLARPVVMEMALAALDRRAVHAEAAAQQREAKRLLRLGEMIRDRIGASALAGNGGSLARVDAWLLEQYPRQNGTEARVREAMDAESTHRV